MDRGWIRGKSIIIVGDFDSVDKFLAYDLIIKYNCKVIAVCSSDEKVQTFKEKIVGYEDNFSMEVFDTTIESNWKRLCDNIKNTNRKVDILINLNLKLSNYGKFESLSQNEFEKSMTTYYYPIIFAIRYLLPLIKESRVPSIITILGMESVIALKGLSHYSASRSAVKSFIEVLSDEIKEIYFSIIYIGVLKGNSSTLDYYKNVRKNALSYSKTSTIIINKINKKRKKVIIGRDAKTFDFLNKISPKLANKLTEKYLKIKIN